MLVRLRLPKIDKLVLNVTAGLPPHPLKSIDLPALGMSIVTVRPATNELLTTTSSWGNGTLLVHPCVDHVNDAVPVAV